MFLLRESNFIGSIILNYVKDRVFSSAKMLIFKQRTLSYLCYLFEAFIVIMRCRLAAISQGRPHFDSTFAEKMRAVISCTSVRANAA